MARTVLITGAASGIGRATAREFEDSGWRVYATDIEADDVDVGDIQMSLDVTEDEQVEEGVERVVDDEGRFDVLVNNAGDPLAGPVEEVDVGDARAQMDVNLHGPHRLVRAALPHMRRQRDGTIVNVSSVLGRVSLPGVGTYCASKHALEALSDALRVEVSEFGVDVVLVEPGGVNTGFEEETTDELEYEGPYEELNRRAEKAADRLMNGALASKPEDVGRVIRKVAEKDDPDARYTVGPLSKPLVASGLLPSKVQDIGKKLMF